MARHPAYSKTYEQIRRHLLVVLLAAAALIAAAGIIVFVHGQQTTKVSPLADPSRAPSRADAAALAALLRQGTPDTAPSYWETPSATLEAAAAGEIGRAHV